MWYDFFKKTDTDIAIKNAKKHHKIAIDAITQDNRARFKAKDFRVGDYVHVGVEFLPDINLDNNHGSCWQTKKTMAQNSYVVREIKTICGVKFAKIFYFQKYWNSDHRNYHHIDKIEHYENKDVHMVHYVWVPCDALSARAWGNDII